jgi:hypothetical protein
MSTPTSFNTDIASGRTELGFVPALSTVKRSPASRRNRPSAICDRAEFPVDGISKSISSLHHDKASYKIRWSSFYSLTINFLNRILDRRIHNTEGAN